MTQKLQINTDYYMSDHDKQTYGNRMAKGFTKMDLLGKGGCAIVWLAYQNDTRQKYAVKQFPKQGGNIDHSARVEQAVFAAID